MSEISLLIQLKNQLLEFLNELIQTFPTEPDFVMFSLFVDNKIPIEDIMKYIVKNLCPLKSMVEARNEDFFLKYNILFEKFEEKDSSTVSRFKKIWTSPDFDNENKEIIWKWFHSFIYLGNKYLELTEKKVGKS